MFWLCRPQPWRRSASCFEAEFEWGFVNPANLKNREDIADFETVEVEPVNTDDAFESFSNIVSLKVPQVLSLQEEVPRSQAGKQSDEHCSSPDEESKEHIRKGDEEHCPEPTVKNAAQSLKGL
mmetsp:Transcript_109585/g.194342  ORF Transcript_109585/g.194342 Transcript_109585/m.194342 type:complete len:123 (-) Transcript_109585:80-448(-)